MMPNDTDDFQFGAPLECKFDAATVSTAGEFSGLASAWSLDHQGDRIRHGAFSATLAAHKSSGLSVPLLFAHRQDKPIGRILKMQENEFGLDVTGKFNLQTTAGREAREFALAGDLSGLSIGYRVPAGGAVTGKDGRRTLQKIDLAEISLVAAPANDDARIRQVKTLIHPAEIARVLHAHGYPDSLATKMAQRAVTAVPGAADFYDDDEDAETQHEMKHVTDVLRANLLELKSRRSK